MSGKSRGCSPLVVRRQGELASSPPSVHASSDVRRGLTHWGVTLMAHSALEEQDYIGNTWLGRDRFQSEQLFMWHLIVGSEKIRHHSVVVKNVNCRPGTIAWWLNPRPAWDPAWALVCAPHPTSCLLVACESNGKWPKCLEPHTTWETQKKSPGSCLWAQLWPLRPLGSFTL